MKKKMIAVVLAAVLVLTVAVGGTLAWLLDVTKPVVNTFMTSDVDIKLTETTAEYKMIPGYTIAKNPTVTVNAASEKCYVFVKVEKSDNFDNYMTYIIADGWAEVETGVYYRVVEDTNADQGFAVLKDNEVTVRGEVTKEMLNTLTEENLPTLTFTAYACQYYTTNNTSFTVGDAWSNVKGLGAAA